MNKHITEANHRSLLKHSAVFGNYPIHFRQHLLERSYSEATIERYLHCVGTLAEMMKADEVALGELGDAEAVALIARAGWSKRSTTYATFIVRRFIQFLSEQGAGKPALPLSPKEVARAELRRDYEVYSGPRNSDQAIS